MKPGLVSPLDFKPQGPYSRVIVYGYIDAAAPKTVVIVSAADPDKP